MKVCVCVRASRMWDKHSAMTSPTPAPPRHTYSCTNTEAREQCPPSHTHHTHTHKRPPPTCLSAGSDSDTSAPLHPSGQVGQPTPGSNATASEEVATASEEGGIATASEEVAAAGQAVHVGSSSSAGRRPRPGAGSGRPGSKPGSGHQLCTYAYDLDTHHLAPTPLCDFRGFGKYGIPGGAACQGARSLAQCPRPGEGGEGL